MYFNKTILILEDHLLTVSKLLERLYKLEGNQSNELTIIVLTSYKQVEDYINTNPKASFDIALLDRDCKLGKSFHTLDIERFGADKIIAISSIPEWNEDARKRGVQRIILKDYAKLDEFAEKVVKEVENMLSQMPMVDD